MFKYYNHVTFYHFPPSLIVGKFLSYL